MPSIFNTPAGTGGLDSLSSRISFDANSNATAGSRFAPSPGRASVNVTKPETAGQSLEALGKGFLGLVGSIPLVGGVAKGALELSGGIAGNVLGAVGSFKPVQNGPSVGDVIGGVGGAALDVIAAPQRFVVNETFNKSIARGLINQESSVKDYYNIPEIRQMVNAGASVDELAAVIQKRGASFGATPDIGRDLVMGLITDPLTYVPFGAISKAAKVAGALSKDVRAGVILAEADAKFLNRWQPVGDLYNAIAGRLSGTSSAIAHAIAGRVHNMVELAFSPKNLKAGLAKLSEIAGPEAPQVLARLSEHTSTTLAATAKSGVAALIEDQAALVVKAPAQNFVLEVSKNVERLKEGFLKAITQKEKEAIVKEAISLNAELFGNSPLTRREVVDMVTGVLSSTNDSQLADVINTAQSLLQKEAIGIKSAADAERTLALEGQRRGRAVVAAGARLLIAGKQDMVLLAERPEDARKYVIATLTYLGLNEAQAARYFDELVLPAINAKNLNAAVDYLELTRMPAYGKLAEGVAAVRQTMKNVGSRLTLVSSRSLSQERAKLLIKALTSAASDPVTVRNIIKDSINKYDDLYEIFKNVVDTVSPKDVIKQLEGRMESFVRDITDAEVSLLSKEAIAYGADAERLGYRLGIAPPDGIIEKWTTLTDKFGRPYHTRSYSPYADLVDLGVKNAQNVGSDLFTYKRNVLQSMVRHAFSPRYGTLIAQKAVNQFVIESSKMGLAQTEARNVWNAIHDIANERKILPRGLAIDLVNGSESQLAKVINQTIPNSSLEIVASQSGVALKDAWSEVFKGLMRAYGGDMSDIGFMPAVTSFIKMKVPAVAAFTDNLYPQLRFGWAAPQFQYVQENIEPVFFRFTSGAGVREARIAGANVNDIRSRAILGEFGVFREIGDAQTVFMAAGNYVASNIGTKAPEFVDALGSLARGDGTLKELGLAFKNGFLAVADRKTRAFQAILTRGAAIRAYGVMSNEAPELMAKLTAFFGTNDTEKIMHIIGLDFIGRTDPVLAQQLIKAGEDIGLVSRTIVTQTDRATYQNIVSAFRKAAADEGERARKAIYFDPNRPFWERSLNHPALLLYPLSYMVGKIIPEFTRLMVTTPFAKSLGGTRLFLGEEALRILSESTVAAAQYDPNFRNAVQDNPEFWTLINFLLPYTPDNIGFGFSAGIRKSLIAQGLKGQSADIPKFALETGKQLANSSILGTPRLIGNAIDEFTNNLKPQDPADSFNILDIFQNSKN